MAETKKYIKDFIKFARGANKAPDIYTVPPSILLKIFFALHMRDTQKIEVPTKISNNLKARLNNV